MKKRLLGFALALMLCVGLLAQTVLALTPAIVIENPFTDISEKQFGYESAIWAYNKGVTTGTGGGKFSPQSVCTRAQTVTFLWRALGSPEPAGADNPFTDVKSTDYFYKSVLWAVEKGVTGGTSATTFSPNASCTNAQVVTFLWRANGSPEPMPSSVRQYESKFPGQYFVKALGWGMDMGLFVYLPSEIAVDSVAQANEPCVRHDLVQMLYVNAGYPDIKQYGKPLAQFTSCMPYVKEPGVDFSYQYYIALDIAATQVLTTGEQGSKFTFTAEGTMFDIFRPILFDYVQLPNGDYGQYLEVPDFNDAHLQQHWTIRDYAETQYTLDIAGAADKEGSWIINYPPRGTANQHYDFVQAPNDAAGNIRVYLKTLGGNYVMKTDNGLEVTADKAKATPFYFIRAEQSALGQDTAYSARG